MNKSLTIIDVEMDQSINKTPEANKKKPKQLTLFEMSSGGKFAIKRDQEKELQESVENKQKTKQKSKVNYKDNNENDENSRLTNKTTKSQNKLTSQQDNPLKPININTNFDSDESKSLTKINETDNFTKEPKKSTSKKEDKQCIVLVEKLNIDPLKKQPTNIRDFFTKSQENQKNKTNSDEPAAKIESSKPKFVELSDQFLEEIGSFALKNLTLDSSDPKTNSFFFGDLAMIVELNNLITKIYPEKKAINKGGKTTVKTQNETNINNLTLDTLVEILYKPNSFNRLIKSYLKILLKEDNIFKGIKIFEIDLSEIDINDCMLTELAKIIATINHLGKDQSADINLLTSLNYEDEFKPDLLNALNTNKSHEQFVNLNLNQRIDLVKLMLHLILTGEKYEIYFEQMHNKMLNYEARLKQGESEFVEKLGIDYNVYKSNKEKHIKEALNSKKFKVYADKLNKIKVNLEKARQAYHSCNRILPFGRDSKQNSYWNFSFLNNLIVEKKASDEMNSEWYVFNKAQANQLVEYLKSAKEDIKFIKLLKDKIETLYLDLELDEVDENLNNKDNDIISCDSTVEEDTEDIKSKLAQFERRVTRSLKSTNNNSDDDVIYEKDTTDANKILFENQQEWLDCLSECHTIEDLLLLIANQQIYLDQIGALKASSLKNLLSNLNDYDSSKSFDDQFVYAKQILNEMFNTIWHILFVGKVLTSGKLKFWKQCVDSSKSLSNLYMMTYLYFRIIRWEALNEKFVCKECNKQGNKFRKQSNLKDLNEYDCQLGFYWCTSCKLYIHKECALKCNKLLDNLTASGLYHCLSCDEKKKNFYYKSEEQKENKVDEYHEQQQLTDDEDHETESRKLRKRKQVIDYTIKTLKKSTSNASLSSAASVSTRSSIESEITNSRTRRSKRNDYESTAVSTSNRSTRSSARLTSNNNNNNKPKYVDEDSDYDD